MNSAMQEDDSADFGHGGVLSQPLAIAPVRTESFPMLDETCRMARHPFGLGHLHRLGQLCQELRMALAPCRVFLIGRAPTFLGIALGEAGIVLGSYVAEISHEIHHLVIAQQAH